MEYSAKIVDVEIGANARLDFLDIDFFRWYRNAIQKRTPKFDRDCQTYLSLFPISEIIPPMDAREEERLSGVFCVTNSSREELSSVESVDKLLKDTVGNTDPRNRASTFHISKSVCSSNQRKA